MGMENDGLVHKQVRAAGTVLLLTSAITFALESGDHVSCVFASHALGSLTYDAKRSIPEAVGVRNEVVAAGMVPILTGNMASTESDTMRYLGALLLANLACDKAHNAVLMGTGELTSTDAVRRGVVPALLHCISSSLDDFRVQSNSVITLFNLSLSEPDSVKRMREAGAHKVLEPAYDHHSKQKKPNQQILMLFTSLLRQLEEWEGFFSSETAQQEEQEDQEGQEPGPAVTEPDAAAATTANELSFLQHRSDAPRSSFRKSLKQPALEPHDTCFGDSFATSIRDSEYEYSYTEEEAH